MESDDDDSPRCRRKKRSTALDSDSDDNEGGFAVCRARKSDNLKPEEISERREGRLSTGSSRRERGERLSSHLQPLRHLDY